MENVAKTECQPGNDQALTRTEVAEKLDISVTTVRRLEGHRLHPKKNDRGVWLFDAAEVMHVAATRATNRRDTRRDEGEIAARVFEMLQEGHGLHDIVIRTRQHPKVVRDLYSEWCLTLRDGEARRQRNERESRAARQTAQQQKILEGWNRVYR